MRQDFSNGGLVYKAWEQSNRITSGSAAVNEYCTLNGNNVAPAFRYNLKFAEAGGLPAWGYGGAFTPSGSIVYGESSICGGVLDGACNYDGASAHVCADATTGDWTTTDFVFEALLYVDSHSGNLDKWVGKGTYSSGGNPGWSFYINTSYAWTALLEDSSGTRSWYTLASSVGPGWAHLVAIFDHATNVRTYANGTYKSQLGITGHTGSLTNAVAMRIGDNSYVTGATEKPYNNRIGYVCGWFPSDVGTNADEKDEWVTSRYQQLMGLHPQLAPDGSEEVAVARTGSRYFTQWDPDEGVARIQACGSGLHVLDGLQSEKGLEIFGEVTNQFNYSEDRTQWTNYQTADADSGVDSPLQGATWITLTETGGFGGHSMQKTPTVHPAQNQNAQFQFFVKTGDIARQWVNALVYVDASNYAVAVFDTETGLVTASADLGSLTLNGYASKELGNDWLVGVNVKDSAGTPSGHICAVHMNNGATLAHGHYTSYNGTPASAGLYWTGGLYAIGHNGLVPYVKTAGAAATKARDDIQLPIALVQPEMSICFDFYIPADASPTDRFLFQIDGGDDGNKLGAVISSGQTEVRLDSRKSGGTSGDADASGLTALGDRWVSAICAFRQGRIALQVDGSQATAVADIADPSAYTNFYLGSNRPAGYELNGRIRNFRIHNRCLI